jgi:hypothetical protein
MLIAVTRRSKKGTGRKMGLKRRRWLSGKLLKRKRDPTLPYGHLSLRREEEKVKRKRKWKWGSER